MASASAINALDTRQMPTRVGENSHPEYAWATDKSKIVDLQERFVQLFFQMVRTKSANDLNKIGDKYSSLLHDVSTFDQHIPEIIQFNRVLNGLINHTRDIVKGKGERDLAYTLLLSKYDYQVKTIGIDSAINNLVNTVSYWCMGDNTMAPPGSWKDISKLCVFAKKNDKVISRVLRLLAKQIRTDIESEKPSLAAKWAPRESSKNQRWIFYRLVRIFYEDNPTLQRISPSDPSFKNACSKLRKTLSSLNKKIDTLEVKQCANTWSEIVPHKIPSVALQKQKKALLNLPRPKQNKAGEEQRSLRDDRIVCAKNIKEFVDKAVDNKVEVKAQKVSLYDLIRDALERGMTLDEKRLLEEQWKNNGEQVKNGLPPMIPMVDVSGSMCCDNNIPLYYAIALGLRASEKTHPTFRNRILTFSEHPAWVRLPEPPQQTSPEHPGSFINRVLAVRNAPWGMNTDFYKALKLILDSFLENSVPPEEAKGMVLAVFSDMQIDEATTENMDAMDNTIRKMYNEHGYEPPHILYWNLRTTDGFPAVTTRKNITMLSGFSPVLLNVFEDKGIEALSEYTPYRMISEIIDTPRFTRYD